MRRNAAASLRSKVFTQTVFRGDLIIGEPAEKVSQGMRRVSAETSTATNVPRGRIGRSFCPNGVDTRTAARNTMRHTAHRPGARLDLSLQTGSLKGAHLRQLEPML